MPIRVHTAIGSMLTRVGLFCILFFTTGYRSVFAYPVHMYQTYGNGHAIAPQNTYQDLRMNPASNVVNSGYHVNRDYSGWLGGGQPLSPYSATYSAPYSAPSMPYTALSPYHTKLPVLAVAHRLSAIPRPVLMKAALKQLTSGPPAGGAALTLRHMEILRRHHQSLFDQLVVP
ncbi:hypothetical protein BV898_03336 [Hypsibius exemplaris]|uniref:Uncharacterized protein n=1 Tax=Hypsibius exemplaris TaxID=2072580 RepID=A0A1W0X5X8_HYPEX|nr:hypothetical protein BV898_03336 [Hypsibius exemplaris]